MSADTKIMSAETLLKKLWESSANHFTQDELKFFTNAQELAELELSNLGKSLNAVGCLIQADEMAGNFKDQDNVSSLVLSVAHQLEVINGFLTIAGYARDRIDNPEFYKKPKAAKGGNNG